MSLGRVPWFSGPQGWWVSQELLVMELAEEQQTVLEWLVGSGWEARFRYRCEEGGGGDWDDSKGP